MTITLAHPASTSPVTEPRLIATTLCQCGNQLAARLVPAPTHDQPRKTTTIHLHLNPDTTCTTASPVLCEHRRCQSEIHPDEAAECIDGLPHCCTCCQAD